MKTAMLAALAALLGVMTPTAAAAGPDRDIFLSADTGALDGSLAEILPEMVAAALESGGLYRVIVPGGEGGEASPDEGWDLELEVSGKGPWRLRAKAKPRGRVEGASPYSSGKISFKDGVQLTGVVDSLARDIDAVMRPGEDDPGRFAPIPLREGLSPSSEAVVAYLRAKAAWRSGRGDEASALLDEAIDHDPRFVLASAEKAFAEMTAAGPEHLDEIDPSALDAEVLAGFDLLARGSHEQADRLASRLEQPGHPGAWGEILGALSASLRGQNEEAARRWRATISSSPRDPRPRMWLGRALFAAGEIEAAGEQFRAARSGWGGLLMAYTLEAETQVRERETFGAREIVDEMKQYMESEDLAPAGDDRNPWLMLGSVDLMEGRISGALSRYEKAVPLLRDKSVEPEALRTMLESIVEIRRDMIRSRDRFARDREIQEARQALQQYGDILAESDRTRPWERMRLEGLLTLKEGNTVEAWRILEELQALEDRPGYDDYHGQYLAAAITLKEGDIEGSTARFENAAEVRGRLVDLLDVAQMQSRLRRWELARSSFETIGARLELYDPSRGRDGGELILPQPRMAALTPIYHYARAQLGYMMGDAADSRLNFNRMLKYLIEPDETLLPLVQEALGRGARPE